MVISVLLFHGLKSSKPSLGMCRCHGAGSTAWHSEECRMYWITMNMEQLFSRKILLLSGRKSEHKVSKQTDTGTTKECGDVQGNFKSKSYGKHIVASQKPSNEQAPASAT